MQGQSLVPSMRPAPHGQQRPRIAGLWNGCVATRARPGRPAWDRGEDGRNVRGSSRRPAWPTRYRIQTGFPEAGHRRRRRHRRLRAIAWPLIDCMNPSGGRAGAVVGRGRPHARSSPARASPWSGAASRSSCATHGQEIRKQAATPLSELTEPVPAGRSRQARPRPMDRRDRRSARISAACRSATSRPTRAATTAAGSAPATAASTTRPAAFATGPAPLNLYLPPYAFETDTKIKIG